MNKEERIACMYPEFKKFLDNEGALPKAFAFADNPFEEELARVGADGLKDLSKVSCWLKLTGDMDINKAIQMCFEWKKKHMFFYEQGQHIYCIPGRNCKKKIVILLDAQKNIPALTTESLNLCMRAEIHPVFMKSKETIYDIAEQKEYTLRYLEYPGSVDDAATYGEWYLY